MERSDRADEREDSGRQEDDMVRPFVSVSVHPVVRLG